MLLPMLAAAVQVTFEKTVLDTRFVSEGVALGDIDRDGKLDIVAGNVWYEAPKWKPHEIAPVQPLDPKTQYSNCFHCWTEDLNHDGWTDQIVIGMPGENAIWRENPKGGPGPWKEHLLWRSACNESPFYGRLLEKKANVLVMGTDDEYLAWFEPDSDPYKPWTCHRISEAKGAGSQRYSHGLGVVDITGDDKKEVLTTKGFYRREGETWAFVATDLGPDCAQMLGATTETIQGLFTTSAHARGVWRMVAQADGTFKRTLVDDSISQTHAAAWIGLGASSVLNLVTGKRKWAHPPGVDIGSDEPSLLVRYEYSGAGPLRRVVIDENSGVGTQIVIQDVNGDRLADIVTSNKNGVFLFVQRP